MDAAAPTGNEGAGKDTGHVAVAEKVGAVAPDAMGVEEMGCAQVDSDDGVGRGGGCTEEAEVEEGENTTDELTIGWDGMPAVVGFVDATGLMKVTGATGTGATTGGGANAATGANTGSTALSRVNEVGAVDGGADEIILGGTTRTTGGSAA